MGLMNEPGWFQSPGTAPPPNYPPAEEALTTYRTEIGDDAISFLLEGNEAGAGPLVDFTDHVTVDYDDDPGAIEFDEVALAVLQDRRPDFDASITHDANGIQIWFEGNPYPVVEVVQ